MISNKVARGATTLLACAWAACTVPSFASASFMDRVAPVAAGTPASALPALDAVPQAQVQAFGVLRGPATDVLPQQIRAVFDSVASDRLGAMGVDARQARRVAVRDRAFYIVPGSKALCIFAPTGAACAEDVDWVARHGFSFSVTPPQPGNWWEVARTGIGEQPQGPMVTYGIVPDGVTSVSVETLSGATAKTSVDGNAYVIETDEPLGRGAPTLTRTAAK